MRSDPAGLLVAGIPSLEPGRSSVNRIAFLAVYLAWLYGIGIAMWSLRAWRRRSDPPRIAQRRGEIALGLAVMALIGTLFLPWVEGVLRSSATHLVEIGWASLDPASTVVAVVLAALAAGYLWRPTRGGDDRAVVLGSTAGCLGVLIGANAVIRLTNPFASEPRLGAYASLAAAAAVCVTLVAMAIVVARAPGV